MPRAATATTTAAPKANGIDFIDPTTGRWMHFVSQRYAKWSATFMSNITAHMNANAPMPNVPSVAQGETA